jgi:hypothetical protein
MLAVSLAAIAGYFPEIFVHTKFQGYNTIETSQLRIFLSFAKMWIW